MWALEAVSDSPMPPAHGAITNTLYATHPFVVLVAGEGLCLDKLGGQSAMNSATSQVVNILCAFSTSSNSPTTLPESQADSPR